MRKPSSFTPSPVNGPYGGKSLFLGDDPDKDYASIAQVWETLASRAMLFGLDGNEEALLCRRCAYIGLTCATESRLDD